MDTEKLKTKITESGLKKKYIVSKLNITLQGFNNKLFNKTTFKTSEVATLKNILKLSDKEVKEIFFL